MIITNIKNKNIVKRIQLEVVRQWFHSLFAISSSNRPEFTDSQYTIANQISNLAWKAYGDIGVEIRELEKELD